MFAVAHIRRSATRSRLVLRNAERAREDLKGDARGDARRPRVPPAFGLYFDCVSRGAGSTTFPDTIRPISGSILGQIPLAGFFTGFEIGPLADAAGCFSIRACSR